jgi:hypothetical protein
VRVYRADDEAPAISLFARPDGRLAMRAEDGWRNVEVVGADWTPETPEIPELHAARAEAPRERC